MTHSARPVDPTLADESVGMSYLERAPRRLLTIYLPLSTLR